MYWKNTIIMLTIWRVKIFRRIQFKLFLTKLRQSVHLYIFKEILNEVTAKF